jgi:DUF2934 family protein
MDISRASTPAKPNTFISSKKTAATVAVIGDAVRLEHRIRERAYQLYEGRGCEPGLELQDWAQAEQEILNPRP